MTAVKEQRSETHTEKLERLTSEVEALREELRRTQRLATVGTMTAMVAHEFNNILTPIINYAQLAQRNPKMVQKAIDRASEGGQRATEICQALLGITRNKQTESTNENLLHIVQEILAAMAREPSKDGIELSVDIPENMQIFTRRLELQQVLMNLLVNARASVLEKPTPRRIRLSAEENGENVVIRVSDNGIGIPPEILDKIFQPFFTTKSGETRPGRGGHGLGLAICNEIVNSLNGHIDVESKIDTGACFTIVLPKG